MLHTITQNTGPMIIIIRFIIFIVIIEVDIPRDAPQIPMS